MSSRVLWTVPVALLSSATASFILSSSPLPLQQRRTAQCHGRHRSYSTRGSLSEYRRFYREGELLGEGSFAIVKKAIDLQTKEAVAVKQIDKAKSDPLTVCLHALTCANTKALTRTCADKKRWRTKCELWSALATTRTL